MKTKSIFIFRQKIHPNNDFLLMKSQQLMIVLNLHLRKVISTCIGCIFAQKFNELYYFILGWELSAFSFSAHNISFASNQSSSSNSILNESNSHNVSSNIMNEMHNGLEQQRVSSSNESELDERQEVTSLNDHDAVDTSHKTIAEDTSATNDDVTPTNKPEKSLYKPEIKFSNRGDVEKYIDGLKCFRHKSDNVTSEATVSYYVCSQVPKRQAYLCPSKMKIVEQNDSRDFCIFVTTFDHNHENIEPKQNPISQKMKDKIYELKTEYHMKPASIHKYILKEHPKEILPTIKQIQMILPKQREKNIPRTKTYGELIEWCRLNEKKPESDDDAFVLGHLYNKEDDSFAFVITTPRLLENARNRKNVCADGTYKIVWEEFPLIVVGTIDRLRKFHMIAMCLTSNERESEYTFVFDLLARALKDHFRTRNFNF